MKKKKIIIIVPILMVIICIAVQVICPLLKQKIVILEYKECYSQIEYLEEEYQNGNLDSDMEKLNYIDGLPSANEEDYVNMAIKINFQNVSVTKIRDAVYTYTNTSEYADRVVFAGNNHIVLNSFERFGQDKVIYDLYIFKRDLTDEQVDDIIKNTNLTLIYDTELFGVKRQKIELTDYTYENID